MLHLGIYIYNYHRALVLKFLCMDAVLERDSNLNRVDDESIQNVIIFFIFQLTKYSPDFRSFSVHDNRALIQVGVNVLVSRKKETAPPCSMWE